MTDKRLVLSTCGSHEVAAKIARALVDKQVAACVNILGPMESIYRWEGQVETSQEFLLLIKTSAENFERLCAEIRRLNPYQLPEVIQFTVEAGLPAYLDWIGDSVTELKASRKVDGPGSASRFMNSVCRSRPPATGAPTPVRGRR